MPSALLAAFGGGSISGAGPHQGEPAEQYLAPLLGELESRLSARPLPRGELIKVADATHRHASALAPTFSSPNVDLAHALLVLEHVLYAFLVEAENLLSHFTHVPKWVYMKLLFLRRAQIFSEHRFAEADPTGLRGPSAAWTSLLRRRWPRADALPRRVLLSVGCPAGNATLSRLLARSDGWRPALPACRDDLAVFPAGKWRAFRNQVPAKEADLYRALWPHMAVRPMKVGKAIFSGMINYTTAEYVTDPTGLFLEFGVYVGSSLNIIARRLQALGGGKVYGFDSLNGLPEEWAGASVTKGTLPSGFYKLPEPPQVEPNAELVVGYFNQTLPAFLQGLRASNAPVPFLRFLHLDADLYGSTREVLDHVGSMLRPGSILVVDDLVNFPSFREHGLKALGEFLARDSAPDRLEVLGAPWFTTGDFESLGDKAVGFDIERAVAFRVL